ncbi:unnamed protein product, partial [Prorocentrum cordatum]
EEEEECADACRNNFVRSQHVRGARDAAIECTYWSWNGCCRPPRLALPARAGQERDAGNTDALGRRESCRSRFWCRGGKGRGEGKWGGKRETGGGGMHDEAGETLSNPLQLGRIRPSSARCATLGPKLRGRRSARFLRPSWAAPVRQAGAPDCAGLCFARDRVLRPPGQGPPPHPRPALPRARRRKSRNASATLKMRLKRERQCGHK